MKTIRHLVWTFAALAVPLLISGCNAVPSAQSRRPHPVTTNGHLEESMLVVDSSNNRKLTVEEGNRIRADVRKFLESKGPLGPGTYTVRLNFQPDQPGAPGEFLVVQLTIFAPGPVSYELLAASEVPPPSYSMSYSTDLYSFNDLYRNYNYGYGYGYQYEPTYCPVAPTPSYPLPGRPRRPDDDKDHDKDRPTPPGTVGRHEPDNHDHRPPPTHTVARDDNRIDYSHRSRPVEPSRSNDSGSLGGRSSTPTQNAPTYNAPVASSSRSSGGSSYTPPPAESPRTETRPTASRDDSNRQVPER